MTAISQAKRTYNQYRHIIAACNTLESGFAKRGIIEWSMMRPDIGVTNSKKMFCASSRPTCRQTFSDGRENLSLSSLKKRYIDSHGWEYKPGSIKHPQYTGTFITKYVYEPLPPGVLEEMKTRLPK